jgi:4'-phosphopantetheinyl transferase
MPRRSVETLRPPLPAWHNCHPLWPVDTWPDLWTTPPVERRLTQDVVHVWRLRFEGWASRVDECRSLLSLAERGRADRFRSEKDRIQHVLTHAVLRLLLGRYLALEPKQVRFAIGPRGKPEIAPALNAAGLRFNVSHTRGLALLAFTRGRDVGVDVETARFVTGADDIAARLFSSRESACFRALPDDQKQAAFLNCWTRREAYLKATGEGIAESPDQIEVSFAPGEPARLLSLRGDPNAAAAWHLQELVPGPEYVAALAVKGHARTVVRWDATV